MPLSWNEIRARATKFAKNWENTTSEKSEAQTFWNEFFDVFGVSRRRVASFEHHVSPRPENGGIIDLLWKGIVLIEHKSRGRNLDRAYEQAISYFPGIQDRDLPRYIIVSDFARIRLYDLETSEIHDTLLIDFPLRVDLFGFIAGYETRTFGQEDPVNIKAALKMGELHDELFDANYKGHRLEALLIRLLFCMFADTTGIFQRGQFREYLELRTLNDGSDLGNQLGMLFQVLNQSPDERQSTLDEQLTQFPWVDGKLFEEALPIAAFNSQMREILLDCCKLDWGKISPAIFGSIFQSVMDQTERRKTGGHYTSETNILKALKPLFIDTFEREFEQNQHNIRAVKSLHKKLSKLKILDPACGCGNFLSVAYRELRLLEIKILRVLYKHSPEFFSLETSIVLNVNQLYGIEINEFPAQIAQVAMWLTDHQMNLLASMEFGQIKQSIPLRSSANIIQENALEIDWAKLVKPKELSYIVGNPPFIGAKHLDPQQTKERNRIFAGVPNAGVLDYVCCWYKKAALYMHTNSLIRTAFVSTNSITQGEQVGALWNDPSMRTLFIIFAHRTFQWTSEARGKAAVHCVIIGTASQNFNNKYIYEYDTVKSEPKAIKAAQINPYLVDAPVVLLPNRRQPLCHVPIIGIGNKPIDDGNYLFAPEEKMQFLLKEPKSEKLFRRWIGADEFINGIERWCLYLKDCPPEELRALPEVMKRIEAVRKFRLKSTAENTRMLASQPTRFHVENAPEGNYLIIPEVSSELRNYVPIGIMSDDVIPSNLLKVMHDPTLYHFGIISSKMHMSWVRAVAGRLESRYRYSIGIVYNNFPWPDPSPTQKASITKAAKEVLSERDRWPAATLADLYDPNTMPPNLVKAHYRLDKAVDAAYGKKGFASEAERVAFLFKKYQELINGFLPTEKHRNQQHRKPQA